MTSKKNYFKVVSEKSNIQNEMEHTAANGQKNRQLKLIRTVSGKVVKQYQREQCAY